MQVIVAAAAEQLDIGDPFVVLVPFSLAFEGDIAFVAPRIGPWIGLLGAAAMPSLHGFSARWRQTKAIWLLPCVEQFTVSFSSSVSMAGGADVWSMFSEFIFLL
ncbi:hypothetical protein [Chitinimonas koreensis]|uniref:hypothetical protein n=1 Tax=Chitinimonas koreensis TaxID=356302 RepID=UPI0016545ADA|nr:hypothetical protein [Chitinimonas koreensis]QNM97848.1 hypothetical protein H9L41_06150 [Chitinimonas koreensis]